MARIITDDVNQKFVPQIPPVAPDNFNLTRVIISHQVGSVFSAVLGQGLTTVTSTAIAAHRPRDVAIVLDFSGSMNDESSLWNNHDYLGDVDDSPNNKDTVRPEFGPYSESFSPNVRIRCTSTDSRVGKCNVTQSVLGISAMVNDFYQNASGSGAVAAFTAVGGSVTNTSPGGDGYLMKLGSTTTPAINWGQVAGSVTVTSSTASKTFSSYSSYSEKRSPATLWHRAIGARPSSFGRPSPMLPTTGGRSSS